MAELKITVCDHCGALDRSVRRYTVITDRRSVRLDLCDEHAGPLDTVVELIPESRPTVQEISAALQSVAEPTVTGPTATVTPVDEIAARKRNHRPKPTH